MLTPTHALTFSPRACGSQALVYNCDMTRHLDVLDDAQRSQDGAHAVVAVEHGRQAERAQDEQPLVVHQQLVDGALELIQRALDFEHEGLPEPHGLANGAFLVRHKIDALDADEHHRHGAELGQVVVVHLQLWQDGVGDISAASMSVEQACYSTQTSASGWQDSR